jgi:nucleotide-binding universal stress UspA family protein
VSVAAVVAIGVACLLAGGVAGYRLALSGRRRPRAAGRPLPVPVRTILLPLTGQSISRRAFDAAVRLAKAEDATLMPAFLARVPRTLPLDAAVPRQSEVGMPLLEALEQDALARGVAVDARVVRGRSYRDALRRLLEREHFDRVVVSATDSPMQGLSGEDLRWLLDRVPAEVLILRPAPEDTRSITGDGVAGHF